LDFPFELWAFHDLLHPVPGAWQPQLGICAAFGGSICFIVFLFE
jgi:hypothetical protein